MTAHTPHTSHTPEAQQAQRAQQTQQAQAGAGPAPDHVHPPYGCHEAHDDYLPYSRHEPYTPDGHEADRLHLARIFQPVNARLDEHLPADHKLSKVYRVGAGLTGVLLLVFGILGLTDNIGFFSTGGDTALGLNTNGALSVLSICVGLLLIGGMIIGGTFASTLNIVLGVLFIASGFVNLALLDTGVNFLAFHIQNVLFSFVVGVMLMWFGMYGRVGSALPHDNPYWQARHPEQAAREQRARTRPGLSALPH